MDSLDAIRKQIEQGNHEAARQALARFLHHNPNSVSAWTLLAGLLPEPAQKADCFRSILALEPHNQEAARALQRLTAESARESDRLFCPQCGGKMEVRFEGRLKDKRAACQYCGTEIDLPDAYQRVERQREQHHDPRRTRSVETTLTEARSDYPDGLPEIDTLRQEILANWLAEVEGAVERGTLIITDGAEETMSISESEQGRWLEEKGIPDVDETAKKIQQRSYHTTLRQDNPQRDLSLEEIIQAAGGPLPPQEQRKCPKCDATISKKATRCEWCRTWLPGSSEGQETPPSSTHSLPPQP